MKRKGVGAPLTEQWARWESVPWTQRIEAPAEAAPQDCELADAGDYLPGEPALGEELDFHDDR